ncbi:amino acid adenylation domain-containing protein [Hymenobacter sp. B81]|uniref:amino acid adenylation domain-containing protein n=1 Tax=Hymenobacter sp. B81 TaxID=3344878 RepID=UPI0037DD7F60
MNDALIQPDKKVSYWLDKLQAAGGSAFYELTLDDPSLRLTERAQLPLEVPAALAAQVLGVCKGKDLNVYKLVLAALGVLLHKYTLRQDVLLTTPGVQLPGHTAPLALLGLQFFQVSVADDDTAKTLLGRVHQELEMNLARQEFDYEELAENWLSQPALAQLAFATGFYYEPLNVYHPDLEKVDWLCKLYRDGQQLRLEIDYQVDCYSRRAVELLGQQLLRALELMSADLTTRLDSLNVLSALDQELIFGPFNATDRDFCCDSVIEQFERQAAATPDAVAVKSNGTVLTYRELNERGNQLAHYLLRECGLQHQEKVAVMVNRSERIIIGIIGILKAGGWYIPVDLSSPPERIQFFVDDSQCRLVLTETELLDAGLVRTAGRLFSLDHCHAQPTHTPERQLADFDLAYMIYTSGTTGKPKGAMVYHLSLANHVSWFRRQFALTPQDSTILINSYSFDGCYSYIWATLTGGGTLHVPTDSFFDPDKTLAYIKQEGITFLKVVPSTFGVLVNSRTFDEDPAACRSVRIIKQGGETINVKNLRKYLSHYPNVVLGNHYGATEATIGSVAHWITKDSIDAFAERPVVGSPFDNQRVYVLDQHNQLLPVGVSGQICIGGVGVGAGYYRREELTAHKFIDNPFGPGRLYKTGDQGRWLPDGTLAFSGRIDNQVKIRGYRVELDEVAETLKEFGPVRDAVALLHEPDGQPQLTVYCVLDGAPELTQLQEHMKSRLPEYMLPAAYVPVHTIPLTPNGKLDKRGLPDPETHRLRPERVRVAPATPVEARLAELWQELLGLEQVGCTDNFFEIGGHSLKATQLVSLLHREFHVRLPLRTVFLQPTIRELAQVLAEAGTEQYEQIRPVAEQPHYELSHAQKRLWVIASLQDEQIAYNIPHAVELRGRLNPVAFAGALEALVARHDVLRTVFPVIDGEPRQRVVPVADFGFALRYDDLRGHADAESEAARLARQDAETVFDLARGPLVKARLLQLADERSVFLLTLHHIVSDGWSTQVLFRDILTLYRAFSRGEASPLAPLPIQYKDVAAWQNQLLRSEAMQTHRAYWAQQFAGELPVLELPLDFARPKTADYAGDYRTLTLDPALSAELSRLAAERGVSLFMVLLAAVKTLLYRYTGQQDLIVGSPIAGREHADLENQVGFYVNTLAIRSQLSGPQSFDDYLQVVRERLLEGYQHQALPFDELIDQLNLSRDNGRSPLFDVLVVMQNNGSERSDLFEQSELEAHPYSNENPVSKFDLTVDCCEEREGLVLGIEYRTSLFAAARIERMLGHLANLLRHVAAHPATALDDIPYLAEAEQQQLLSWAGEAGAVPATDTIHGLFEQVARRHAADLAVADETRELTYAQLSAQSSRLAARLRRQHQVQPGEVVATVMQRGTGFVLSMLATLKADAVYLPLEAHTPLERIRELLGYTQARVVVTDSAELAAHLTGEVATVLLPELDLSGAAGEEQLPASQATAASLAYVMFTSGSTGKPKGVMIEHQGVVRLVRDTDYTCFDARQRTLQTGSLAFDAATYEIWGPLLNGGQVHLLSLTHLLDTQHLKAAIEQKGITQMFFTTSWFNQLADQHVEVFQGLERVLTGGEKISPGHVRRVQQHCPGLELVHVYGPTENTTFSLAGLIPAPAGAQIPLGRPIARSTAYVVDGRGRLVPPGVAGELWLGGPGLARGYWQDEARTARQFVANPFGHGRLYRSGDVACWREDGQLEFLGRLDDQVKIRGFRVEPAEIGNVIKRHPLVTDAVVTVHVAESGDKALVAYYTADAPLAAAALRAYLLELLPAYMVPTVLMELPLMPLNANGKVDRRALPAPDFTADAAYVAPATEAEQAMARLWAEVLNLDADAVSAEANFFELGGHSLKAIKLVGLIHRHFGAEVPLARVFAAPTLRGLLAELPAAGRAYRPLAPAPAQETYPLSSAQSRMYFLQQFEPAATAYNVPGTLALPAGTTYAQAQRALQTLTDRHDSLRTSFEDQDGTPVQRIHASVPVQLQELPAPADPQTALDLFVRPFNLNQAPLFRAGWLPAAAGEEPVLLLDFHHIITDGLSQALLQAELQALLRGETLPPVAHQYKDYVCWQQSPAQRARLQEQQQYWLARFADERPTLQLPTDFARPETHSFEGAEVSLTLSEAETQSLHALCRRHDVTPYMALLAVWTLLLSKFSGQHDITVGTPVAGRAHPGLKSIVGLFVNTLPMRSQPAPDKTLADYLREVKAATLAAFDHQDFPFEELVELVGAGRDLSRNPLFDTVFGLLSRDEFAQEVDGSSSESCFDEQAVVSKFDLNLRALELERGLYLSLTYSTRLFGRATIGRLLAGLRQLLTAAATAEANPTLAELSVLSAAEREQLLVANNQTAVDFATATATVNQLIEAQAELRPEAVALVDEQGRLTYRELNQAANRLAAGLRRRGVGPGALVGILLPPTVQIMVAVLAVYKAGGAYVPLDTALPTGRIRHILDDSGVKVLLSDADGRAELGAAAEVLDVHDPALLLEPADNQPAVNSPEDLAYVIYTSGSTGKPKGVMIQQRSLVNYIGWYVARTDCRPTDRTILTSSYSFDFAHTLMFPILTVGGQLHVVAKETYLSPEHLAAYLQQHAISYLKITPTLFSVLLKSAAFRPEWLAGLRHLMLGGEVINVADLRTFFALYPDKPVINHYGPTETTVGCVSRTFTAADLAALDGAPIIGKPISNLRAYVLDASRQPVPVGAVGQLYLAGAGVSPGYLHQPALTRERFVPSPFAAGDTLYATGDLARWLPDGNLVCLGRADHQIKIRGYRVELGEIERVLAACELVNEACVCVRRDADGDLLLAAFVAGAAALDLSELRRSLKAQLPEYMVPAVLRQLPALPLTPNGKLDRQLLTTMPLEAAASAPAADYEPAATPLEAQLQQVWEAVLGQGPVSVTASFFEIGGHSLKALKATTLLQRETGVNIPLKTFFRLPTIRQQAAWAAGQTRQTYEAIVPAPALPHYPLSHAQMRLWVLQQLDEQQTSYNVPSAFRLRGPLDLALLEASFRGLLQRHEILRTVFRLIDGEPRQVVLGLDELPAFFEVLDLRPEAEPWEAARELLARQANQVFDLAQGPLLRVQLLQLGADEAVLALNIHHIVSDGWSAGLLQRELLMRYNAGRRGPEAELAPLPIQYKDYAYWQHETLAGGRGAAHAAYWQDKLAGELPSLALPADFPRPAVKTFNGDYFQYVISPALAERLEALAARHQASPFMLLLAALKTLFFRYTGATDLIIGTPVAGREKAELNEQLGFYVNTLALRTQLTPGQTFAALLDQVKDGVLEAFEHQHYPFDRVVSELGVQFDPSRSALFDVMLVYQNNDEVDGRELALEGLQLEELTEEFKGSKFDLTFVARRTAEGLQFHVEYNTDLYRPATLERMLDHLNALLASVAARAETPLTQLGYLSPVEEELLLSGFNQTGNAEPLPAGSVQACFERQVALNPTRPALLFPHGQLSYQQLNEQANQLAHWIQTNYQVGPDQLVAFVLERSEWQVITLLAILKTGAAFLPIDPAYPAGRIRFILEDARPVLTLVERPADFDAALPGAVECLPELLPALAGQSTANPADRTQASDLAYVIYTSGSTGAPKGVMVEHGGSLNMVRDQVRRFAVGPADRCLQFASISFDASVYETFMALYAGSALVLLTPGLIANPERFLDYVLRQRVTVATLPPVYLASLEREKLHALRVLITAGEAPNLPDALALSRHLAYYNAYGPTEYSVCATTYRVRGDETSIPIGQPIDNTQALILDASGQLLPAGFWGELHLAGAGLARGYVNRPELTAQRFVAHPWAPGQRLYRTGDQARWRPDGQLEFRGRLDNMVKIRGYRVELAEIEQALLTYPDVSQAIVTYEQAGPGLDQLSAYVVAAEAVAPAELKNYLAARLPQYMVPGYYCQLAEVPVTVNGKVDLRALPRPGAALAAAAEVVAPASETEQALAALWQQVLQLRQVGVTDNFYDLGGQSILAMRLIAGIWKTFGINVSIRDLMRCPTIREQAALLLGGGSDRGLLLPLNRLQAGQPTLFMVPPVVGSSSVFRPLAAVLEPAGINCYGLQHRGFDYDEPFDQSLAQMARSFAREITAQAPAGQVIYLLGYSMGALLAAETAQLLEAARYQVELVLLDSDPLADHARFTAAEADAEALGDELLDELLHAHLPTAAGEVDGLGERMRRLLRHNLGLLRHYRPQVQLTAPILALEAEEGARPERMRSWQGFTRGPVTLQRVPGHHFSLLDEERLPGLARHLLQATSILNTSSLNLA